MMKIECKIVWQDGVISFQKLPEESLGGADIRTLTQEAAVREMSKIIEQMKSEQFQKGKKSVVDNIIKSVEKFVS